MPVVETNIKVGDKLNCILTDKLPGNDTAPDLDKEKEYDALELHECTCGQKHVHVGLPSHLNWVKCYNCGEQLPNGTEKHWCHPSRFTVKS